MPAHRIPAADATLDALLGALSYQDQQRILKNLLWDAFGAIEEDGTAVLLPGRNLTAADTQAIITSLRQELWPELYPTGSDDDDDDEDTDHDGIPPLADEPCPCDACAQTVTCRVWDGDGDAPRVLCDHCAARLGLFPD